MNAIERTGIVDAEHQLRLDEPLAHSGAKSRSRDRVGAGGGGDFGGGLVKSGGGQPGVRFLEDAAEDVYTAADGKPFHDQG